MLTQNTETSVFCVISSSPTSCRAGPRPMSFPLRGPPAMVTEPPSRNYAREVLTLLELHLGRNGATMNVGMGGADVSLGTIAESMSGLRDTLKISGVKLASLVGSYEGVSTLNVVNMLGYSADTNNFALGRAIWGDKIKVRYSNDVKVADGMYGQYNGQDLPNEIQLSSDLLGNGKELAAKLAAVMAHEGTHVAGNRYEALAHQQGLMTYGTLLETFGLQGDRDFVMGMITALMDPKSYEANTGNVDRWLTKIDGTVIGTPGDPRQYRERYDIDGNIIKELVPGSNEQGSHAASLFDLFGEERITQRLGDNPYNIDNFDTQTLKDVLHWDDETIQKAKIKGGSINVDGDLKKRLLG
jgi:hypothetical protein